MKKGHKYRIYPTKGQAKILADAFGCARYIYNRALIKKRDLWKTDKKNVTPCQISKWITEIKREIDTQFLQNVPDTCLRQAARQVFVAYDRFFEKVSKYPQLKDKTHKKSCTFQDVVFKDHILKLPKLGKIDVKWTREVSGEIKMATVSMDSSGRYFVSFQLETEFEILPVTGNHVGIDVGLKDYCIFSDGTKVANPKFLKHKKKALRRSQRALARSEDNSKRREKKRVKIAKLHAKIADTRRDFQHKLTTNIVRNNDIIVVEDLRIKNMMKNHKLAGSIADASWHEFTRQLDYKSSWYGRTLIKVSPNYTSRDCSCCGHRNEEPMKLQIREWACSQCGTSHDRDINAAKNILNRGLDELQIPRGTGKSTDMDIPALAFGSNSSCESGMDEVSIHDASCNWQHDVAH